MVEYQNFIEVEFVLVYLCEKGVLIVIKVDGLVVGKGVIVVMMLEEVEVVVYDMLVGNVFGDVGYCIVIEEFFDGEEVSFIVMVDGEYVLLMVISQDYKCVGDKDIGLNIGGMGVYFFVLVVIDDVYQCIMECIIWLIVKGMVVEGNIYIGFFYVGLMIDKQGNLKVIEFNCCFGDSEIQLIMLCMKFDLVEFCLVVCESKLDEKMFEWDECVFFGVVMVVGGYLGDYCIGDVIYGLLLEEVVGGKVFYVGIKLVDDEQVVINGGCVLCVIVLGYIVVEVQKCVYVLMIDIYWDDCFCWKDIGWCVIECEQN